MSPPKSSDHHEEPVRVLFLCTGNSCRSQMAEAILHGLGGDRFQAFSAGSHPAGFIHPLAIEAMRRFGFPLEEQCSKGWGEFSEKKFDVVITLCDHAAGETCPLWPGKPLTVHWFLPDPAYHHGAESERTEFALRIAERIMAKVRGLTELDWSAPRDEIKRRLEFLGEI